MSIKLVYYGDPVLRKKGKRITVFDAKLKKLAHAMMDVTIPWEAWGLAAHQVGKPLQLFVIHMHGLDPEPDMEFTLDGQRVSLSEVRKLIVINPEITPLGDTVTTESEGCLSFPDTPRMPVTRPWALELKYQDENGTPHTLHCNHWLARAILHEFDHLQGILYIDYASGGKG